MTDTERTRVNDSVAAADNASPAARTRAIAMIDEGNLLDEQGRIAEAMARYDAAVEADPQCARAHLNRGNILLAGARIDEARSAYQLAVTCEPRYAAAHYNLGNLNSRAGDSEQALRNYQAAIGFKPDFADALVAMANLFDSLGRTAEAVEYYERALAVNPGYAEVHFNLGILAATQGWHDQAVDCLRRATEIEPNYALAHHALGKALSGLARLDEAEASFRRAYSIEPESEEFLYDLAIMLLACRRPGEALQLMMPALDRAPKWSTKIAFASCVVCSSFTQPDSRIRSALTTAITEPWGLPYRLCRPALSLIMLNPRIAGCVRFANASWPARLPRTALFGAHGLAALAADPLLHAVLEAAPVTTVEFECFMTGARYVLLETASSEQAPDPSDLAALRFYAALARQCFINEYIFDSDDRERSLIAACRTKYTRMSARWPTNSSIPETC